MASQNGERQEAILQLRFAGLTYAQIAGRLEISRQRVHQLIAPPTKVRDKVIQCAGGQCQDCGIQVNGSGHVHHLSCHGEDYNDLVNLRLLCASCHRRAHSSSEGDKIMNINLPPKLKCLRCRHEWTPRQEEVKRCPKCNSPYWDKPKREGK